MGVNSKLDDDTHALMWDFDNVVLSDLVEDLKKVQIRYWLSDIHILETNKINGNYIAYCFSRQGWKRAMEIVLTTPRVDWNFVRISMSRGWFTLRVGAKITGTPKVVRRLEGYCLPDCEPTDLKDWVEYETLDRR